MISTPARKPEALGLRARIKKRLGQSSLLAASLLTIGGALLVAAIAWVAIGFPLNGSWPWGIDAVDTTRGDAVWIVLTMVAGIGGIVALVIAYRKQRGTEEGRFMASLENAARQLGALEPTIQFAGIYALSALADESGPARKQQCVDVLCGYLRLPYTAAGNDSTLREVVKRRTWFDAKGEVEETRTHQLRPSEKQVRLTIIREITERLQEDALNSWSNLNLDFTGVVFDGGNFSGASFNGGSVSFMEAKFSEGIVSFAETKFNGASVTFMGAEFSGAMVSFISAEFNSGNVSFLFADFNGGDVFFQTAEFSGAIVSFQAAKFNGGALDFSSPGSWKKPPEVDWDPGVAPIGINPSIWPPEVDAAE